jgi:hypothetical protein
MKTCLILIVALLISVLPAAAMPVPSQATDHPDEGLALSGGSRPEWAGTFGYVSLGCAGLSTILLVDSSEGDDDLAIVLLLPGLAWLMIFAR